MTFSLTDAARELFAREVAKYPADQKVSAVMACLAIVQQEQGHVSPAAEDAVAEIGRASCRERVSLVV